MHLLYQHACIDKIKTVASLANNKDVFMCILRFHARAGYLQTYETLLEEDNVHPGSEPVRDDQHQIKCAARTKPNLYVPCNSGI